MSKVLDFCSFHKRERGKIIGKRLAFKCGRLSDETLKLMSLVTAVQLRIFIATCTFVSAMHSKYFLPSSTTGDIREQISKRRKTAMFRQQHFLFPARLSNTQRPRTGSSVTY